jgi:hypothetical protein
MGVVAGKVEVFNELSLLHVTVTADTACRVFKQNQILMQSIFYTFNMIACNQLVFVMETCFLWGGYLHFIY